MLKFRFSLSALLAGVLLFAMPVLPDPKDRADLIAYLANAKRK